MTNAFFVVDFLSCRKKRLDEKNKLNFKIYDVTASLTKYPNISRSKVNQTMKFGQAIEYNKRNIFLQKSSKK